MMQKGNLREMDTFYSDYLLVKQLFTRVKRVPSRPQSLRQKDSCVVNIKPSGLDS